MPPLAIIAIACSVTFALLWFRQTRTNDATSVDAAWAAAIGALALAAAAAGDGHAVQRVAAAAVAGVWSGRLSWHLIAHRVLSHAGEDGRYRAMRQHWGTRAHARFFWFYQLQAAAAFLFALPFWFVAGHDAPALAPAQFAGLAVIVAAQALEALADRQLEAHRRDPSLRGRACRRGLWRYSRHPNYFFEWLTWCGIALLAAPAAGWWAVVQPAAMFVLVRFVSGVPYTELQALKSRGDDYRRYQQETNAFVPWLPRRIEGP
ncbi:MAG: DUF1295 domain-containing protein [Planctomycetes bacterium]|nr:DUF1295 domain-containing protein [Planctomycetota bacterium]